MSKLSRIDHEYSELMAKKATIEARKSYCERLIDRITTNLAATGRLMSIEQKERNDKMLEAARAELQEIISKGETLF